MPVEMIYIRETARRKHLIFVAGGLELEQLAAYLVTCSGYIESAFMGLR